MVTLTDFSNLIFPAPLLDIKVADPPVIDGARHFLPDDCILTFGCQLYSDLHTEVLRAARNLDKVTFEAFPVTDEYKPTLVGTPVRILKNGFAAYITIVVEEITA